MSVQPESLAAPNFEHDKLEDIVIWMRKSSFQTLSEALQGDLSLRLDQEGKDLGWGKIILGLVVENQDAAAFALLAELQQLVVTLKRANLNREIDNPGANRMIMEAIDLAQMELFGFINANDLWEFPAGIRMKIKHLLGPDQGGVCNMKVASELLIGLDSSIDTIKFNDDFTDGNTLIITLRWLKGLGLSLKPID